MKRWLALVLSVSLLLAVCVIGAAADEPAAHRVVTQVLGEGTVIPDVTTVAHGSHQVTFQLMLLGMILLP